MKLSFVFENFLQLDELLRLVDCVLVRDNKKNILLTYIYTFNT